MSAIMEVNLDKLPKQNAQLIEALLKATGLEDIPETFKIITYSTGAVPGGMLYAHIIELPDGRKYGADFDEDSWNWHDYCIYKWTKEPTESHTNKMFEKWEKLDDIVTTISEIAEGVIRQEDIVACLVYLCGKEEIKKAVMEGLKGLKVTFTDIESEVKVKKEGIIVDAKISVLTYTIYIDTVDVISENTKYVLWGDGYEELPINITIKGTPIRTVVHFPKDLEGVQVS